MKRIILAVCVFSILVPAHLHSENYAGEFMALGGGARAMAMGGAFVSVSDDATSSYWNPAGIPYYSAPERMGISFMHSERFGELINYNFLSAVMPLERGKSGWGITLMHMGINDIRVIPMNEDMIINSDGDDRYEPWLEERLNFDYRDFPLQNVNDYALMVSYGQMMNFGSVGASVKIIRNDQVTGVSSLGIGIDLGLMKKNLWRDLMVGVKLQDATGTYISWSTGKDEFIYPALKVGLGYPLRIESMKSVLLLAADGDFHYSNRQQVDQLWIGRASANIHVGAELFIRNLVALRGGLDMGRRTIGAGFNLDEFIGGRVSIGINYALLDHDELDTTHRVSMNVSY